MKNISLNKHTSKLESILNLVQRSVIDKERALQKVKLFFKDAQYTKTPFIIRAPMVIRAITHENESFFDNISKFGLAPTHRAALNRCNWNREPAFYCSNDNVVPVFETRAVEGQFIAISRWVDKRNNTDELLKSVETLIPMEFYGVVLGVEKIIECLDETDIFFKLLKKDKIFRSDTLAITKEVDRYIGELFIKSERELNRLYVLTSAISKAYFCSYNYKYPRIDGIIYPSVQSNRTGTNLVLGKKYVKKNLKLYAVSVYKIVNYEKKSRTYSLLPVKSLCRNDENGRTYWQKIHPNSANNLFEFNPQTPIQPYSDNNYLTLDEECK